jgi:hypothetical protein
MTQLEHKIANHILEQRRFLKAIGAPENLFDGLFKEQFKQLNQKK